MKSESTELQFERQVRAHEMLIHKVCRMYGKSDSERQDLFQEILIQLWQAWPKFRGESKVSTWMYRIAFYTAIAGFKKKNITVSADNDSLSRMNAGTDDSYREQEEKFAAMYKAIGLLNDIEKAIVMLYLDDKSYKEMEEVLGMTQGNLRVKMNRIKEKLRQLTKNI